MYKIIYAQEGYLEDTIKKVENEVNKLKNQGWTMQGGVTVCRPDVCARYSVAQAMVKNE